MNTITYRCSKALWLVGIVIPFALTFICIASLDSYNWPSLLPVITILSAVVVYYCRQCFTYDLKDKAALLLDDEKLIYYIDNTVIYWKDVIDISYGKVCGQGLSIFFTINKEGIREKRVCVSTDLVAGCDRAIYNDIIARYVKMRRKAFPAV
ncbi:hypothetical protein SNE25_14245 [Mucilaginibacter sabulilitoris]|uniref:PH domain-containing protein n=1 Tax=Mucilaginibacter sabulilitoris TaxID=1173583 RepID=A0ABZ0TV94_9SPHI|nr:hypothetical protein [Mucilaginibacter sabulilitoris]WPU96681.1 hypothetical protein SNE25_14245 [Mucilaginibacter sabulilitoris]